MSKIAVICTAKSEPQAGRIVEDLKGSYYSRNRISVLFPNKRAGQGSGLAAAANAGGSLGGTLSWLTGVGALAVPGAGPCIAAGPLMNDPEGAGASGVASALVGLGMPDPQARHYESKLMNGNVLISVHTKDPDEARYAKEIFKHQGAEDIASTDEAPPPPPPSVVPSEKRWFKLFPEKLRFW